MEKVEKWLEEEENKKKLIQVCQIVNDYYGWVHPKTELIRISLIINHPNKTINRKQLTYSFLNRAKLNPNNNQLIFNNSIKITKIK